MTMILSEGISNLEDLDVRAFVNAVKKIGQMQATEKLDGAGMWFGLDAAGKLYTSRPGKKADRFYSEQDYPYFAGFNGFRGAHAALQAKERDITSILSPGETIEASVLFGRQPNSTTYGLDGKNFIAIVRGVEGTNDLKAEQLLGVLNNSDVSVRSIIVDSSDGVNLDRRAVTNTYRFIGPQRIKDDLIKGVNVSKQVKKLENFLDNESGINGLTNFELMTISLGSIPKEQREEAKAKKAEVLAAVKNNFKLQIKKELLDTFVSKVRPSLMAADASADEDVGVGGVVLRDPETGELIDLADTDSSNTVNAFNNAVRSQVSGTVRTTDDAAPLEVRGGLTGQLRIRIADLLGNKDLAMTRQAKDLFIENRGDTPTQTIRNVAKLLNGAQDFNGVKRKIDAMITATLEELQNMLQKFLKHKDDPESTFRLRLKNGKAIGLSPEIVKRTLMTFAEARRNLTELQEKVSNTKTFEQLVAALYGKIAKEVQADGEGLTESLQLNETRRTTNQTLYSEAPDAWSIVNAYLATVMMAVLMYKADDEKGIWLLRDKHNYRMKKHHADMSAVNFWGYALWRAKTPAVSKLLSKTIVSNLSRWTSKVPKAWVNLLHLDLSYAKDVPIDWDDHLKTLKYLVQHSDNVNTDRVNTLLRDVFAYEESTFDEKTKLLPKLYLYAMQFVPSSPLLTRVRIIQNKLLGGTASDEPSGVVMTKGQRLLGEDGEIAPGPDAGPAVSSGTGTATAASAIASVQTRLGSRGQIIRRQRNPEIKFRKFKRPESGDQK